MNVIVSPRARDDLIDAYDRIIQDNPEAADRLLARFNRVINLLAEEWMRGRRVRLRNGQFVQTWPVPPYRSITWFMAMNWKYFASTIRLKGPSRNKVVGTNSSDTLSARLRNTSCRSSLEKSCGWSNFKEIAPVLAIQLRLPGRSLV